MKKLILYASKHGTTEKASALLAEKLTGEVERVNVQKKFPDLRGYDYIIIGGSIHAGQIQKEIKKLCEDNLNILLDKKIGLFLCCGLEDRVDDQMKTGFGSKLYEHARVRGYFGYEFNFDKMNFLERLVVKVLAKVKESKSSIYEENIEDFANKINESLT
ncbi:flavodoxin domain-containing protein [Halothermothrix orenii]|uniref:Flavodoxin n=1 Tax=Halothermothrix orenii (strain H 168 / OCM 544 / DSM 9562) TaxID=373903 RepID=B8D1T1_HALOH|nr:flavodoxin domain-containing protein [Halothermothrix orenii]ACL69158.1 Flavodoxin [Halothermothrix orenii H 168]